MTLDFGPVVECSWIWCPRSKLSGRNGSLCNHQFERMRIWVRRSPRTRRRSMVRSVCLSISLVVEWCALLSA